AISRCRPTRAITEVYRSLSSAGHRPADVKHQATRARRAPEPESLTSPTSADPDPQPEAERATPCGPGLTRAGSGPAMTDQSEVFRPACHVGAAQIVNKVRTAGPETMARLTVRGVQPWDPASVREETRWHQSCRGPRSLARRRRSSDMSPTLRAFTSGR